MKHICARLKFSAESRWVLTLSNKTVHYKYNRTSNCCCFRCSAIAYNFLKLCFLHIYLILYLFNNYVYAIFLYNGLVDLVFLRTRSRVRYDVMNHSRCNDVCRGRRRRAINTTTSWSRYPGPGNGRHDVRCILFRIKTKW